MDGFETLARLREADRVTPVLFLSARGDIVDKRTGFRLGADDYLVKPFLAEELLLRVEAMLRRVDALGEAFAPAVPTSVTLGSLTVDLRHGEVTVDERKIDLTPKERRIMCVLAESAGRAFTRDELIGAVWGESSWILLSASPCTCAICARRSRLIRRILSTCRRCGATATVFAAVKIANPFGSRGPGARGRMSIELLEFYSNFIPAISSPAAFAVAGEGGIEAAGGAAVVEGVAGR